MNGKRFIKKSLGAGLAFMICMNMAMSVCAQNLNNDTGINVVNEQESTVNETATEETNQSDENSIEDPMENLTSDNEELEAPNCRCGFLIWRFLRPMAASWGLY